MVQRDGNSSKRMETPPEGWMTLHMDGNYSRGMKIHAKGGKGMGEGECGDGRDGLDGESSSEKNRGISLPAGRKHSQMETWTLRNIQFPARWRSS